jgi:transglutaminase/protease-like cytokinesis protein 3
LWPGIASGVAYSTSGCSCHSCRHMHSRVVSRTEPLRQQGVGNTAHTTIRVGSRVKSIHNSSRLRLCPQATTVYYHSSRRHALGEQHQSRLGSRSDTRAAGFTRREHQLDRSTHLQVVDVLDGARLVRVH